MEKITKKEFTQVLCKNKSILAGATRYNQRFFDISVIDGIIQRSKIDMSKLTTRIRKVIKSNDQKNNF